jgi:hypothetical protein
MDWSASRASQKPQRYANPDLGGDPALRRPALKDTFGQDRPGLRSPLTRFGVELFKEATQLQRGAALAI